MLSTAASRARGARAVTVGGRAGRGVAGDGGGGRRRRAVGSQVTRADQEYPRRTARAARRGVELAARAERARGGGTLEASTAKKCALGGRTPRSAAVAARLQGRRRRDAVPTATRAIRTSRLSLVSMSMTSTASLGVELPVLEQRLRVDKFKLADEPRLVQLIEASSPWARAFPSLPRADSPRWARPPIGRGVGRSRRFFGRDARRDLGSAAASAASHQPAAPSRSSAALPREESSSRSSSSRRLRRRCSTRVCRSLVLLRGRVRSPGRLKPTEAPRSVRTIPKTRESATQAPDVS